jgi:cation diffusion facilitator CzcD-associated flavoprotein CzcO
MDHVADQPPDDHHRLVIIGTGFAGLGMAIGLREAGFEDFVLLERAGDLGGTWRDNTYPGCACDVPSHLYSFSFALNPDWSHTFSPQPEIWEYLRRVSSEHRIDPHIRYDHEVTAARWDERAELWRIETSAGTLTAELLISGAGGLADPKLPDIEGIESFAGTMFHTARWDHGHDIASERVGVIGTGASSIQLIPRIQPQVGRLSVFQRTPPWILPRENRPIPARQRRLFRSLPPVQRAVRGGIYMGAEALVAPLMHPVLGRLPERVARRHMHSQVADPALRRALEPNYRLGCKRMLFSNTYYPALTQPNVELVTDSIRAVTPGGILTRDGREHELDTLILSTGFHVTDMPIGERIHGADGRSLAEVWHGSPQAYLGTTVAGFPNMFMLAGPNTGLGHNSIVFMIESQVRYLMECLRHLRDRGLGVIEVREEVMRTYNEELQRRLQGSVWTSGGCSSWYIDENGRNTTIWPGSTWPFRRRLERFDPSAYRMRPRGLPIMDTPEPSHALSG